MSDTQARVQQLLKLGAVQVSQHGFARLDKNEIDLADVIAAMQAAKVVEDHPDYPLGPCVLVLVRDSNNDPVHILWGIPKGQLTSMRRKGRLFAISALTSLALAAIA